MCCVIPTNDARQSVYISFPFLVCGVYAVVFVGGFGFWGGGGIQDDVNVQTNFVAACSFCFFYFLGVCFSREWGWGVMGKGWVDPCLFLELCISFIRKTDRTPMKGRKNSQTARP